MGHYTYRNDTLYRKVWDDTDQVFVERFVVPAGGQRTFVLNGRKYKLSLRKSFLLLYHDSETDGAHASQRDTLAKLSKSVWWPTAESDVRKWVQSCSVCRLRKPHKGLTTEQRMELHDKPFRVIFIDALGPISPPSQGAEFVFHAEDPFSRWVWLHCSPADTAEEWARFLVEDVFFDLCGFPAVLRSDRGAAFTSQVIASVNQLLGITHAFGTAFHPQSQGYVEGRHKSINNDTCRLLQREPS